ncbi:hypothetical protein Taro_001674 [Colocasia esculenta]|uniref:DNA-(apurinic or apyrimidinic site) endonuclease n=1 Tax=Colocasia esculenta TaxID=4460 RepID=A0A843TF94_COLES|nr:hypothetical protein [Colocasia esculenta]
MEVGIMLSPFEGARISHLGNLVCCSCALAPRDFRVRALTVLGRGEMGAKRWALNTPNAGEKKVKKSVGCTRQPEDGKAGEENRDLGIDTLRKDHSRLEAMTVKELRAVIKDNGINAKGRKQDLISALENFLLKREDESTSLTNKVALPTIKTKAAKETPSEVKTKDLPVEDSTHIVTSEQDVSGSRKLKSRGKLQMQQSEYHEGHSGTSWFILYFFVYMFAVENWAIMDILTILILDSSGSQTIVEESSKTSLKGMSLPAISDEPWTILAHKKPKPGWVPYNPKTMRPPTLPDSTKSVKLISWNVNGLRALLRSGGLDTVRRENFDVLCLQETKMQARMQLHLRKQYSTEKDVDEIKDRLIEGYDNSFWTCSVSKLGYSGTAVISRIKPISVKYGLGIQDHDGEGRLVTVEFDTFYLLGGYVPNSGEGLRRLTYRITEWDTSLSNYMKDLEKSKPVILTGDLNCAHEEIDIYNPAGNRRSAGFTDEERQSFEKNFLSRGFVDTFRRQHPGVVGYTYWGFRHGGRRTNRGWRLDYFLVSECMADDVHDSYIMPDVVGSDHCPIGLVLKV